MSEKKLLDIQNIQQLKPAGFWKAFYEINQVPRGTKNMTQISKFLANKLKELGCEDVQTDNALNIVAHAKATDGLEHLPMITLQAHMDMVCAKEVGSNHNFLKDPIKMFLEDGWVLADKTTLGGDDGYGVAAILATLSEKVPHGPLEIIFTTDEEEGLGGVSAIDTSNIKGKYYLNLDGDVENQCIIGSAGVFSHDITYDLKRESVEPNMKFFSVSVKGLVGGHSGAEIHRKRINAIQMLVDILFRSYISIDNPNIRLISLDGGEFRNSIPAFATIVFGIDDLNSNKIKANINAIMDEYKKEYIDEESFTFTIEEIKDIKFNPISKENTERILMGINSIFNGLHVLDIRQIQMDSSTNMGVASTTESTIKLDMHTRGNSMNAINRIFYKVESAVRLSGGKNTKKDEYKPWPPKFVGNKLADMVTSKYEELFGKKMNIMSTPGGLEASILLEKCPSMVSAVNIAPDILAIHSINEKINVASVERFWKLLCTIYTSITEIE